MEWSMKETTEKTGISADTLRYYEKEGLLSPQRRENGYRYYSEEDMEVLKKITVMKYAHFTISEMKSIEALFNRSPNTECNELSKEILNRKAAELNLAISGYQKIVVLIEKLLPMINTPDEYRVNAGLINELIDQIYSGIKIDYIKS